MYVHTYVALYECTIAHINVTGFVKTVPIGTTIEIHFMA